MELRKPTRQEILQDFKKWVNKGSCSKFQYERAKRRWKACDYPLLELNLLFKTT